MFGGSARDQSAINVASTVFSVSFHVKRASGGDKRGLDSEKAEVQPAFSSAQA